MARAGGLRQAAAGLRQAADELVERAGEAEDAALEAETDATDLARDAEHAAVRARTAVGELERAWQAFAQPRHASPSRHHDPEGPPPRPKVGSSDSTALASGTSQSREEIA